MTMTYAPAFTSDSDELARWDALPDSERSVVLASLWLALDPATAHARFAAAVGLLALVDEELDALQEGLDRFREQFEAS